MKDNLDLARLTEVEVQMMERLNIFRCPSCGGDLDVLESRVLCIECNRRFKIDNGIPQLFWPHETRNTRQDVTQAVKEFYEESPFPNYDSCERTGDLVRKAEKSVFARLLNEQVPFRIRVLEVGCGTGQLSNYLAVAERSVFGTDICLNSLRMGQTFRDNNGLFNAGFYQMNLFRPIFKEESFSLVICNGVLHHTSDPYAGFRSISKLVKKGGYILVGLYNRYGRILTDLRRRVFSLTNDHFMSLDPRLRKGTIGDIKKLSWFRDQYKHPHESKHTMGEVLGWFKSEGFVFINGIPKLKSFDVFSRDEQLFKKNPSGLWIDRFITQMSLAFTGSREGGLFIMIGQRQ